VSPGWTTRISRARGWLALTSALCMLFGCAAHRNYEQGQKLVNHGQALEGLAKLDEARRLEPGSARYGIAYLTARDRIVLSLLTGADVALAQSKFAEAERLYREILRVSPTNDRALAGLEAVDAGRRRDRLLSEAERALGESDAPTARARLEALLVENPKYPPAVKLLRQMEEQTATSSAQSTLAATYSKPITLEFKDAVLRSVFELISHSSGLNFVFDKDVRTDTKTSIFLKNTTIESAVSLLLLTNQLEQRVLNANTVLIYPNTPAKQKDYQPLVVRSFYLANADAKSVANTLKTILKTRDLVIDEKRNMLMMRDSADAIRLAEKLVALNDVPEPEVMLEVEILEVNRSRLQDLGIRWPDQASLTPLAATSGGTLTLDDLRSLRAGTIGTGIGATTVNA